MFNEPINKNAGFRVRGIPLEERRIFFVNFFLVQTPGCNTTIRKNSLVVKDKRCQNVVFRSPDNEKGVESGHVDYVKASMITDKVRQLGIFSVWLAHVMSGGH